ncbi:MAG: hypothetical protein HQK53_20025 [Oligoflexia bacterium]|nr:hypothetical protein [Oligoflexia bacterium]
MLLTGLSKNKIVKKGKFLYADSIEVDLQIVHWTFRPGTGDYEDDPEFQDDQPGDWYEMRYCSPCKDSDYYSGGGFYKTVEAAMEHASKMVKIVSWD